MSDEQKMINTLTIYWKDDRATAQYPEAAFSFRLAPDTPIYNMLGGSLTFTTLEGAKIRVYEDKLLFTSERFVMDKPIAPTSPTRP